MPLATYPDAIKAVVPLIDEGKTDEAIKALRAALNTLVVTEEVIPLPLLRSKALLARAEELAKKSDRSEAENEELAVKLKAVRNQVEIARILGYSNKDDLKEIRKQLDEVEEKTKGGRAGENFFDKLNESMRAWWASVIE